METTESIKNAIKEAVQTIQDLDFGEDACSINCYSKKNAKQ